MFPLYMSCRSIRYGDQNLLKIHIYIYIHIHIYIYTYVYTLYILILFTTVYIIIYPYDSIQIIINPWRLGWCAAGVGAGNGGAVKKISGECKKAIANDLPSGYLT